MLKKIVYICEVCRREWADMTSALDCESGGTAPIWPVGLIFGTPQNEKDLYKRITFAIADNGPVGHINELVLWACRDTVAGDSLGDDRCGGNQMKPYGSPDPSHQTFNRMVEWLQSNGHNVTVWDGQRAAPLEEYLEWWDTKGGTK